MRSRFVGSERGYSLIEMLVVVAIVGVLSLISVPAFMNFQRQSIFRTSMRDFITDLRRARQMAISQAFDVRVQIDAGSTSLKRYQFYSSRDNGTTWTALTIPGGTGTNRNIKFFPEIVWVNSTTNLSTVGSVTDNLIVHPNGGATITNGAASASIVMRTLWKNIAFDRYTITISPSGQFLATGDHT